MTTYSAPTKDMQFVITELAGFKNMAQLPGFGEATTDLLAVVLEEAGKLAAEVLAPLNQKGDQEGAKIVEGKVIATEGFKGAYQQFIEGGWMSISQSPEYGGQGLPHLLLTATSEMWNASNLAFSLCPLLTTGAIEAIEAHANESLKKQYLPKLVSGEWAATMNLTEPQAGTDLAAIRSKAVRNGDHYLVSGQKIFITWGDHELTENIAHLVLARLPDAPDGVRGISLFLVPKFLLNADGSLDRHNDLRAVSLEHKMGIHGSPTCVMSYGDEGGAIGYLVGEENKGLSCMFTMMNHARLGVGTQGVAIADRSYQQAVAYARDRLQGEAPAVKGRAAIIHHADVRRMLMTMRALTEAARAVNYVSSAAMDFALRSETEEQRGYYQARIDLLTPIAKGWCTEVAQEVTSLGVQVHGGMGFIEETGCAQHMRDARITTIYEGTTGIQAMDLVGRKILRDGGQALTMLLSELTTFERELEQAGDDLIMIKHRFNEGRTALNQASEWLRAHAMDSPHTPGAIAFDFLMLMGTVIGGWQMARAALISHHALAAGEGDEDFYKAKFAMACFYAQHIMPRAKTYLDGVLAGEATIMGLDADLM